jgi:hypothetical protein
MKKLILSLLLLLCLVIPTYADEGIQPALVDVYNGSTDCWAYKIIFPSVSCSNGVATPGWGAASTPIEYNNSTCTTAMNISAANGPRQKVTLTNGNACVLTFVQPNSGTITILLKIIQSASSTYNGTISGGKWPGGSPPTITATTGAVDIISCYLDGTNAYCVPS